MSDAFIIFLKGVHIDDYKDIADQFNARLMENVSEDISKYNECKIKYDSISPNFTSMSTWNKSTNLLCWNCGFSFTSIPVFIPTHIRHYDSNEWNITVYGNFCSFSCAARHVMDYMDNDLLDNLIKLYEIFYKKQILTINPSPRKYIMLKYGGYMTEETFLNQIKQLSLDNTSNSVIKKYTSISSKFLNNNDDNPEDFIWDINENE